MSDPLTPSEREKRETAFAGETRSADPGSYPGFADSYSPDHYLVPEEDLPVVHQEPLFSRRVLFGWAFATLIVVFTLTVIVPMVAPIVKETVINNIALQMKERGMNVRVNGQPVEPVIPAIPPVPPVPDVPDVPSIAGEPAPAPHASSATGATPATPAPPHHTKAPAPAPVGRR